MKIADGVSILELPIQGFTLNPTLVWDEESAVLIDTGMPGQEDQIIEAMNRAGVPFERLTSVILTHQDIDHIGCLPELIEKFDGEIDVYAHELDKPYIEGDKPLLKLDFPKELQHLAENPPKAKVHYSLADGEELPFCGGIKVIHTPGHTPGHISLYLKASKTLVAGDAMLSVDGRLIGPVSQTTPDLPTAQKSLEAFLNFDIDQIVCFHGGLSSENPKEQLKALVRSTETTV
jgi:glyoxylase-like metal-dependent hydrolase (beta-lactamase superfamily II)